MNLVSLLWPSWIFSNPTPLVQQPKKRRDIEPGGQLVYTDGRVEPHESTANDETTAEIVSQLIGSDPKWCRRIETDRYVCWHDASKFGAAQFNSVASIHTCKDLHGTVLLFDTNALLPLPPKRVRRSSRLAHKPNPNEQRDNGGNEQDATNVKAPQ